MRIDWRPRAHADLEKIVSHIAQDSVGAAYEIHDEIIRRIASLSAHPQMGRSGRARSTRELVIVATPYIVIYGVDEAITILRIVHGAQRWPP
jgi:toxin ParE1/3/4